MRTLVDVTHLYDGEGIDGNVDTVWDIPPILFRRYKYSSSFKPWKE